VVRANEQLWAEAAELKQRIKTPGTGESAAFRGEPSRGTKHPRGSECNPKVKKDLTNLEQERAKLKGKSGQ
jgi:hypothetical protein